MDSRPAVGLSDMILQRICGEYLEMPGLRLTLPQAQRLWGLDADTCAESFELLVAARFLVRTGRDLYARLTDGAARPPTLRMAKAALERTDAAGRTRARAS